jgi:uncharacterized protein (DUF1778 family)
MLAGADAAGVNLAALTGENAAENNALFMLAIPYVLAAINPGMMAQVHRVYLLTTQENRLNCVLNRYTECGVMATKTAPINMRVLPSVRDIIDAAASLKKVDRTVFIQQAALNEAHSILAEQRDFVLEAKAFEAFDNGICAEPQALEGMKDLFKRKAPWD